MALIDFAIRAYRDGASVYFEDIMVQHVTHMPGRTGDHAPVNDGQLESDIPLFQSIHKNTSTFDRIKLEPNQWLKAPSVWERRFGTL